MSRDPLERLNDLPELVRGHIQRAEALGDERGAEVLSVVLMLANEVCNYANSVAEPPLNPVSESPVEQGSGEDEQEG